MNEQELKQLRKKMDTTVFQYAAFSEERKQSVLKNIKKNPSKKNPVFLSLGIAMSLSVSLLVVILIFKPLFEPTSSVITDSITSPDIERVVYEDAMILYEWHSDAMDRGDHHFYKDLLVIDPAYYEMNSVNRGDVVYFTYPEEVKIDPSMLDKYNEPKNISRVVGLPGETIHLKDAQIYIDDKKLDAFYGRGLDNVYNRPLFEDAKEYDTEKYTIPEGHVFLLGDAWWRSFDSRNFEAVPIENINGKVLGYRKWK
ncbi:signal peptidase I [Sutcliffiella horikoshii]|uniref:signal peptidase I n=1 Tax=Sutcliffiella horikoshii TaxID=79883 RepID=UPI00384D18F4